MKPAQKVRVLALVVLLMATIAVAQRAPAPAYAQSGAYAINWYSIDAGGAVTSITANGFTVSGTIGQTDTAIHTGGAYTLTNGFWSGIDPRYLGYAPHVER